MADWINNLFSATPPLYQFELINTETEASLILTNPPIEWAEGELEFNRRLDVGGIFTSFTIGSLTFINEGKKFLEDIESDKEINGKAELKVSWFNRQTWQYVEFPTRFDLNFALAKPAVKVGKTAVGFNIPAINSSLLTKFDNRRKTAIDITKLTSVGGFNIVDYTNLKKDFRFPQINTYLTAKWATSSSDFFVAGSANYSMGYIVELSDFTESQSIPLADIGTNYKDNSQIKSATQDYSFQIDSETQVDISVDTPDGNFSITGELRFIVTNAAGAIIKNELVVTGSIDQSNKFFVTTVNDSRAESINTGESWGYFFIVTKNSGNDQEYELDFTGTINASSGVLASDPTIVEAFPIYEASERICQHMLDTQFPYYSEFFGRTDVIYTQAGDFYLAGDQLRFASVMSGLNLRGETLLDVNNPLGISYDQLFKTKQAIWNIGYTLEVIDGQLRIREENYDFFFDDTPVLDFSARIGKYDIEIEVMSELAYLTVRSGYKKTSYEELNGRGEYNSSSERTSIIETDTIFDIVSDIRGDTKGITLQLERSVESDGTKDEKEDNEIFIVKSQRFIPMSADWIAETDENITIEDNSSLFQDGSLNLYGTPTRNLVRNSNRITPSLMKFLSSKLRFQTSDKLQTLKTTGEGYTVTENDDLTVVDLNEPIFKAKKYRATVPFDNTDLETVMANPKGLFSFSSEIQGYLLNLRKKNGKDEATIEIIEKYVS